MDPLLLADVLEPVLNASENDDGALMEAVNLSAEALAALGAVILDRNGRPADGVTDERAVVAALNTHANTLMRAGRLDDVVEALQLAQRIGLLAHPHPRTA
ncbi:hypothetical protein [Azospirillum sp. SYSU D00513]|uniref:hypothetical protein n=1 Tax=Azospirillum sp. SYSU D00513 TaxID=2812561 RepID=UPI001A9775CE|nr:hypothetical protein [Azospirillum sp. SYSU D00513]